MRGMVVVLITIVGWFCIRTIRGQDQEVKDMRGEMNEGLNKISSAVTDIRLDIAKNYVSWDDMREHIGVEHRSKPRGGAA